MSSKYAVSVIVAALVAFQGRNSWKPPAHVTVVYHGTGSTDPDPSQPTRSHKELLL